MADGSIVIDTLLENDKFKKGLSALEKVAKVGFAGIATAVGTVSVAFGKLVTDSVNARGELEQQIGGVKKLFTSELGDASETVINNANKAYKTAGMSAIDYMETVTGFSASLIKSVGGDTTKAAKIADRAIQDMSDNANTFGTDIASIQYAYQGFAKQNYTMLDNLKLGYGGTKEEMKKLIKDASKMKDIQKELNVEVKDGDLSFGNIAQAITVVQKKLGVLGTTEKEAEQTLQGSLNMMKSAWQNFLSGSGGISEVVTSASLVFDNVMRIIDEALPQIMDEISKNMPQIIETGTKILQGITQGIEKYLPQFTQVAGPILGQLATALANIGGTIILESGKNIAKMLIDGIKEKIVSSEPFQALLDKIEEFKTKILEMKIWIEENSNLVIGLAGAVGTLTTAIIAYNAVNAIKRAGGIVELAQLALLQIQIWGLTAAETAHTIATTIATTATAAFGAVMAFITSPVTLVILAIGALITIIVLLVKNWDTVKEKAIEVWNKMVSKVGEAKDSISKKFDELVKVIKQKLSEANNKVVEFGNNLKNKMTQAVKETVDKMKTGFSSFVNNVKEIGRNMVEGLWNGICGAGDWIKNKVSEFARGILDGMKAALGIHSPSRLFRDEVR